MNGQLSEHPLTELIREISVARLSGALRLTRDPVKAVLYFDKGDLVFASSNLRAHRLIECVRQANTVAVEEIERVAQGVKSDQELAARLVKEGLLNPFELKQLQTKQITEALSFMLLWTDGEWAYDNRARLIDNVHVKVDLNRFLLGGARRLPVEYIARRLANSDETIAPAAASSVRLNVPLQPTESYVLSRIEGAMRLGDLVTIVGFPETKVLHATYALLLSGFLERDTWPSMFTADKVAQDKAEAATPTAQTAGQAAPKDVSKSPTAAESTPDKEDDSVRLEELFKRASYATYYQVLSIGRSASPSDIKRAYYTLAKRFHPDRFYQTVDTATRAKVEDAFAKITQAYETLSDSNQRASYDLKLQSNGKQTGTGSQPAASSNKAAQDGPASVTGDSALQAEQSFRQGLAAAQAGNHVLAAASFGEAVRLAPQKAQYHAHYGWALMRDLRTRRQAEAELQTAVKLDGHNASYRVMLAELYLALGLALRAETEIDRALELDPQNSQARQMRLQL